MGATTCGEAVESRSGYGVGYHRLGRARAGTADGVLTCSTDRVGRNTGCGAAWLARLTGGQEVPGSNPGSPTSWGNSRNRPNSPEYSATTVLNLGHATTHNRPQAGRFTRPRRTRECVMDSERAPCGSQRGHKLPRIAPDGAGIGGSVKSLAGNSQVKKLSIHKLTASLREPESILLLPSWLNEMVLFLGMNASIPTAASSAMGTSAAARYRVSP